MDINVGINVDLCGSFVGVSTSYALPFLAPECEWKSLGDGSDHCVLVLPGGQVHDPWKLNKQVDGGHQLCESHCLLMSRRPECRVPSVSPREAYADLVSFWKSGALEEILFVTEPIRKEIVDEVLEANKQTRAVRRWADCMLSGSSQECHDFVLNVLESEVARRYVPRWK